MVYGSLLRRPSSTSSFAGKILLPLDTVFRRKDMSFFYVQSPRCKHDILAAPLLVRSTQDNLYFHRKRFPVVRTDRPRPHSGSCKLVNGGCLLSGSRLVQRRSETRDNIFPLRTLAFLVPKFWPFPFLYPLHAFSITTRLPHPLILCLLPLTLLLFSFFFLFFSALSFIA